MNSCFDCISGTLSYVSKQKKILESKGFTCKIKRISAGWYSLKSYMA